MPRDRKRAGAPKTSSLPSAGCDCLLCARLWRWTDVAGASLQGQLARPIDGGRREFVAVTGMIHSGFPPSEMLS
jgi:hypothetical protein